MRKPYNGPQETFKEEDLIADEPFANFQHWFGIAVDAGIHEPNCMALATASKSVCI